MTVQLLYLDPGSTSMFLQFLIGIGLGIGMFFKTIRFKIRSFFQNRKEKNDKQD